MKFGEAFDPREEPEADPYDYEPPEPDDYEDEPPLSDQEPFEEED